jgi:peptide/nickel transport system permease protein
VNWRHVTTARWLLRRLLLSVLVLWGAATLAFIGMHLLPGNPAQVIAGGPLGQVSPQVLALVDADYGFREPLLTQYAIFLGRLCRGDFGMSYQLDKPVLSVIGGQLWPTVSLALGAALIAVLGAITIAVGTASRPLAAMVARWVDLAFVSTPSFWVGLLLLEAFSFRLHLFPVVGDAGVRSLVLPWITLALPVTGALALTMSEGMERATEQPFAVTVLARGATGLRLRLRHLLRHAVLPALTLGGRLLGELVGGVVVIETVFARQGIGTVTVTAVEGRDLPVVTGIVMLATVTFVGINITLDLLYRVIDPRLRAMPL